MPESSLLTPEAAVDQAASVVARWCRMARQLRDIDTAEKRVTLPRQPGMLPPSCDYCGTFSLRMSKRTGEVRCINRACKDEDGRRPVARVETGAYTGEGALVWRDGRQVVYRTEPDAA